MGICGVKGWAVYAADGSAVRGGEEWTFDAAESFEGAGVCKYAHVDGVCGLADFIEEHERPGAKPHPQFGEIHDETHAAFAKFAGAFDAAASFAEYPIRDAGSGNSNAPKRNIDRGLLDRDRNVNRDIVAFETGGDAFRIARAR